MEKIGRQNYIRVNTQLWLLNGTWVVLCTLHYYTILSESLRIFFSNLNPMYLSGSHWLQTQPHNPWQTCLFMLSLQCHLQSQHIMRCDSFCKCNSVLVQTVTSSARQGMTLCQISACMMLRFASSCSSSICCRALLFWQFHDKCSADPAEKQSHSSAIN